MDIIVFLVCLELKHFILDFVFQPPYMYLNKGTYGHLGGIVHAGLHAVVTAAILLSMDLSIAAVLDLALVEYVIHYHMDWFKMWYGKRQKWTPDTEQFWVFLGLDQLVHQLTYMLLALAVIVLWYCQEHVVIHSSAYLYL